MASIQVFEKYGLWSCFCCGCDHAYSWKKKVITDRICGLREASLEILFTGNPWIWNEWIDVDDRIKSIFRQNRTALPGLLDVIRKEDDFPN